MLFRSIVEATANNTKRLNEILDTDAGARYVGEFAIGTNIELTRVIGHILQDEKFPGIHVAFGDPYGTFTGADWKSTTHIDVVATRFNIWVDDRQIMADGKFLL